MIFFFESPRIIHIFLNQIIKYALYEVIKVLIHKLQSKSNNLEKSKCKKYSMHLSTYMYMYMLLLVYHYYKILGNICTYKVYKPHFNYSNILHNKSTS